MALIIGSYDRKIERSDILTRNSFLNAIAIVNVLGGSIAMGHPFAATGARQILHTLRELQRRNGEFALCTACAAGGLGAAMVLEAR